jgi:protein-tyrosine phosphatase
MQVWAVPVAGRREERGAGVGRPDDAGGRSRAVRDTLRVAAERAGRQVHHYGYPIPDMGVIEQSGYDKIVARLRGEIDNGRTVYLHCWGGKGRTSTVVGSLVIDGGLDYRSAIARIAELRAGTRKARDACPESATQHALLRERAARRKLVEP